MADKINVLIVGSGGREHTIAWKLAQSPRIGNILVAPGNGGCAGGNIKSVPIDVLKFNDLIAVSQKENVQLAVIGPEVPLVDGITEAFKKAGIACFGPSQKASQLEGSKVFAKDFMARHKIPTARYKTFTEYNAALSYLNEINYDVVIKASGLAAGKGVVVPANKEEAREALKRTMVDREFGSAGNEVVLEERLVGYEASVMAFSDGHTVRVMPSAQDHKRAGDGDTGLNTGGMGTIAPAPSTLDTEKIRRQVLQPVVDGMRREGKPYVGVLFAGLMIGPNEEINVLEYNCRFGDPETQVVLPLLDSDLLEILLACVDGCLDSVNIKWKSGYSVCVVAASGGYPGDYQKGKVISGLDKCNNVNIFHAGTATTGADVKTSGGRVLGVSSVDDKLEKAIANAYENIKKIQFEGIYFRNDIGAKALKALQDNENKKSVSYADSGVDIARGDSVVDNIAPLAKATSRSGTNSELGGFGAFFDPKAAGFKDPILVSGTDGVGTKLLVARHANQHHTVGIDLVAMCVNDVVVHGAEPLFFLDYFATGKIEVSVATNVIKGIAEGCKQAGCALVGGETAEMPGMYGAGDYDLAGFTVGAVERDQILPTNVQVGDVVLGLASSGVHSNGFSLVRHLVTKAGLEYSDEAPFAKGQTLGEALMTPTKIYVKSSLAAIKDGGVKALAHITGGGLPENIPRVLPKGISVEIDAQKWPMLPVFKWLFSVGNMEPHEALRTFNCSIGMVLVVDPSRVQQITDVLTKFGESVFVIGKTIAKEGEPSVVVLNENSLKA